MVPVDSEDLPEHSSVVVDDETGARAAAEHLLELGHRDVVVVAVEGPQDPEVGPAPAGPAVVGITGRRLRGYQAAFAAAGLELAPEAVVAGRASIDGGASAFHRAWAHGLRPTAVLAMSDAMAIGAMSAARELGLRVPAELSVVGFDDVDLAAHVDPPLTTVHQPIRQKGSDAVRLLLAEVERRDGGRREHLRLETRLIVRGSTGPAARDPGVSPTR
jgi:DNA-binding LacI/PurR family transcriptional regulator